MRSFGVITYFRSDYSEWTSAMRSFSYYCSNLLPSTLRWTYSYLVSFVFPVLMALCSSPICWVMFAVFHIGFYSFHTAILYCVYVISIVIQSTRVCLYHNICVPAFLSCSIGYLYSLHIVEYYYKRIDIYHGIYHCLIVLDMIAIQVMICSTTQNVLISATLSAFLLLSNAFVPIALHQYFHRFMVCTPCTSVLSPVLFG